MIDEKEIRALARLAKLEFSDDEIDGFAHKFDEIISFADSINDEVEGDAVTIREVASREVKWENLREDEVEDSLPNEKVTSNIVAMDGYFPVRRVVK